MDPMILAVLGIVVFLALILLGMNIGLALLLVGTGGFILLRGWTSALATLMSEPIAQAGSYSLMVIPLFILMGNLAFVSGISGGIYEACSKWLSRLPGGLACGTMAASAGFSCICGSCAATAATMCTISLPEMRKYGYDVRLATGTIAMGGTLGVLIPPSTLFVVYATVAEESIVSLFAAGIIPGILLTLISIITIVIWVSIKKDMAPPPVSTPWKERFKSLLGLIPIVILLGTILGGMFSGAMTVNQSAAVGVVVAVILTLFKRKFNWKNIKQVLATTVQTSSMTFLIFVGAGVFCKFLSFTRFPSTIASIIGGLDVSKYVIILLMTVIYLFLGAIMDELPMILMTVPIFYPIVIELGYDGIWFGVYVILCMELGAIAPPVGISCFIINGIARDIPLTTIYKGVLPFIVTIFVMVGIISFFPDLVTWLPDIVTKSLAGG
jgi:tripartite ATP-independent transporter DctM subunit